MDSTAAVGATTELPACWTPTDQRIMEHLLLDQSDVEDHDKEPKQNVQLSPRTVELNRNEDKKDRPVTKVEEERRERHRAVQRRFIQRKKAEVERTKVLQRTLEHKYRYLEISAEKRDLMTQKQELKNRVNAAVAAVPRAPHVDPVQLLMQVNLADERRLTRCRTDGLCDRIKWSW
jgi:hypothetical protein